ncbi:hypothetical protein JVX92_07655 [Microbacterium hominis]|uniref:hypothetical protein n=1 Tax=Microbacterium hominis TaxID=162426 RepID=UPI00196562EF|nr:hypothetical protein [Microbacterium hominis]QRY39439.1 hypothetical protein JVX92_07655 [Microbacterium hominis]
MSTPTRRTRRPSPAVYRRRRLVAVLILIAVVAAVVLAFWQPWRGSGQPAASPSATPSATPSALVTSPAPETPAADAAASAEPAPAPDPSASTPAVAACSTADISVQAVTDQDVYASGEQPKLSITLSNTTAVPCLINVGTATQSFVITSGSDTWWRSTDCQSESSDQVVQLAGGQTVSSVSPLQWDRTRSSVDTCGSSRPQAAAGYYHLSVSIGGIQAADTKMFELR